MAPWSELPLWLTGGDAAMFRTENRRAVEAGLTFRSVAETARDTLASDRAHPPAEERRGGLARERETELLAAWHSRSTS